MSQPFAASSVWSRVAALPVLFTPVLMWPFAQAETRQGWDFAGLLTAVLSTTQLPSLLVSLAWWARVRRAWWGNAALVVLAGTLGVAGWLPAAIVWPTVIINTPGLVLGLLTRRHPVPA